MALEPTHRAEGSNVGDASAAGVFRDRTGRTLNLRKIKPKSDKISFVVNGDDIDADVEEQNLATFPQGNILLSGGADWSGTGLVFDVSDLLYVIDDNILTSTATIVTLDSADITNPRIDLIVVDNAGVVGKITGTPSPSPVKPNPTDDQVEVTFVNVPAGALVPDVTVTDIYLENTGGPAEWNNSTASASFDIDSVSDPYVGTKSVEVTSAVSGQLADWVAPSAVSVAVLDTLSFRIKSKATWASTKRLRIRFYLGASIVSNAIHIRDGQHGFDSSNTSTYQHIVIPISLFQISTSTVDRIELRVRGAGAAIGFFVDNIKMEQGVPVGTPQATYVTIQGDTGITTANVAADVLKVIGGANGNLDTTVTNDQITINGIKNNISASGDPTVTDDSFSGYQETSFWVNTVTPSVWVCASPSGGSADWKQIGEASGGGTPGDYIAEVGITHYDAPESVYWHVQMDIDAADQPGFATPLISKDSQSDQADWSYRLDGHGTDGNLVAVFPPSGVPTNLGDARGDDKRVATMFYKLSTSELSLLTRGKDYWIRSRQSANQGVTWGDYFVDRMFVP